MELLNLLANSDNPLESARKIVAPFCKDRLNEYILNCKDCKTCSNNKVLASGNPDANILIIADNATEKEEVNSFFNELLDYSNIDKKDIFIIHSVSCICKRKDKNEYIERIPSIEEAKNCKYFINYAIQFIRPRIIISMGATALNQYIPNSNLIQNIDKMYEYNGIPTIITYSSSDLFKLSEIKSEKESEELVNTVINAFNKAQKYINNKRRVKNGINK